MTPDQDLEELLARSRPSLQTVRRILPFARPYRWLIIAPLAVEIFFVLSWSISPMLVKIAVDDFMIPGHMELLVGAFYLAALMALNSILTSSMSAMQRVSLWRASERMLNDLRRWLFEHIQGLSMDFFDREKQGRIIARVDRDVEFLKDMITDVPILVVHTACTIVVVGGILYTFDWRLCLLVAALASNKWGLPAYRGVRRSISRITANLAENVSGVHVVQAYGREDVNLSRFQMLLKEFETHTLAGALVRGITFPTMMLVFGIANAGLIAYAGYAVPRGYITVGDVLAASMYVGMIYGPVMMISRLYDQVLAASAAAERLVLLMDRKPTIADEPAALPIPQISGRVTFDHVFMRYDEDPNAPWILKDIGLDAQPGEIIALVGATGSGKSSIVNLIPRFYQPQQGRVLIDGIDIRSVSQRSLHQQMGIVLQDNFLFTGSVMDNLKYGRPETTDEEAIAAAKALGSHYIIEKLAEGYQTDVRERGGAISHGERQLICFTRALIADPRILILDEATSAVDTETEAIIQRALWKLMEGRTTFVVAHRLSTVRHADRIFVIQDGSIIESGTHAQLMTLDRAYADMFEKFCRQT